MEKSSCFALVSANILSLLLCVAAQQGFLNLNCGGTRNITENATGLIWSSDSSYIDAGKPANINNSSVPEYLRSLRFFPNTLNKSCYQLPVKANVPYLIRLSFLFDNYNGIQKLPSFTVSMEAQGMLFQQNIAAERSLITTIEKILMSSNNTLYVCFIRSSNDDDPFVSAIELRSLLFGMYGLKVKPRTMLSSVSRYDFGANYSTPIRYPVDQYDRFWQPPSPPGLYNVSLVQRGTSDKMVSSDNSSSNFPPNTVMQTAIIAKARVSQLSLNLGEQKAKSLVALYFGEVEAVNASESRIFDVVINNKTIATINFSAESYTKEEKIQLSRSQAQDLVISLQQGNSSHSSRGPLINAMERYDIIDTEPETDDGDVSSLLNFKRAFPQDDLMSEWISDPCFGVEWNSIKCYRGSSVRVVDLNLSGRNLAGPLPDLCKLTELETLQLQNNKLSSFVPDCLTSFTKLRVLNLENNNFTGVIPAGLLSNKNLKFMHRGNPYLCESKTRCHPKDKIKAGIVIGSTMAAVLAVLLVLISTIIYHSRYSRTAGNGQPSTSLSSVRVPHPVRSRPFRLAEMKAATQNFSHKIGEGGFGSVYFGKLEDGKEVAVKLLSASSKQGVAEFLNEIDLLSRMNHKNLVSLLGYCNVPKQLMLVYEHMDGGSLKDHLYGCFSDRSRLDWRARLRIALDAAEGLEYLHLRSTPKIIHRDVKSSNILLDSNMRAKVADFGLSKILNEDKISHVTTVVKGTVGYLDPEYFRTNKLTERSDVYSFGIVLLEIICGRKPVEEDASEEEVNIVKWVMLHAEATESSPLQLTDIIDRRLRMSEDDLKSFYHLINLSINCTHNEGSKRPTMSEIVTDIRDAIRVAEPRVPAAKSTDSSSSSAAADNSASVLHVGR